MRGVKELFKGEGGKVTARSAGCAFAGITSIYVGIAILIGGAATTLPILAGATALIGGWELANHSRTLRKRSEAVAKLPFNRQDVIGYTVGLVSSLALMNMLNVRALVATRADNAPSQKTAITAPVPHQSAALENQFKVGNSTYVIG